MSREKTEQTVELVTRISTVQKSKWANRFIMAAIVQGALAAGVTAYMLYNSKYPQSGDPGPARIVAGGGAGTWLAMGYLAFIMFGPLAAAVTSLFYQHIEVHLHNPLKGSTNAMAWAHLVLMNVGVVGATFIMMNGGYRGGALAASVASGGGGHPELVHSTILSGLVDPIGYFTLVALVGAFVGGIGYVFAWRRALKLQP